MTAVEPENRLRERVLELAHNLGFDLCRFTSADPPAHSAEFQNWLGEGAAGEMAYLARNCDKRCRPEQVLPGVQSVIVLAINYFQGQRLAKYPGRIARYAWGKDYHVIVEKKLSAIDAFLRTHGGAQKCYVDTGPVLERDHAAAAGAGWHGKSTMLLNRELGTWFFLAEVFTTLAFSPDPPAGNHCGTCRRCIDACPTGALTDAHYLDARRCISYLTIELKGPIPLELRPLIGDRIYGCDDCLDVCPWNRFARISREAAFSMPPKLSAMRLRDYLSLTEETFRELFRESPMKRTKWRGLLRNVCVALGNVGTMEDLPALETVAQGKDPLVAEHAEWAIARIHQRNLRQNC